MTFEFSKEFPLHDLPRAASRAAYRVWFADKSALRSMIAAVQQHTMEVFAP